MKSVILLGAPGSGKGTIAAKLKDIWNVPHISTGDMFRAAVKQETVMGLKASEYMKAGKLVPDEITIGVVEERFMNNSDVKEGFLLDGFPRTAGQAEALDVILDKSGIKLSAVILLDVNDDIIVGRITGRRGCTKCGKIYHIKNMPPRENNFCDNGCGALTHRKDDTEEVVRERLDTYHKQTSPLIDYYKAKGLLFDIDATTNPDDMLKQVEDLGL
jgi:adenylate kinase